MLSAALRRYPSSKVLFDLAKGRRATAEAPMGSESSEATSQDSAQPSRSDELDGQVQWQADATTSRDSLNRHAPADEISLRLRRRRGEEAATFLVLLDADGYRQKPGGADGDRPVGR